MPQKALHLLTAAGRFHAATKAALVTLSRDEEGSEILTFPVRALRSMVLRCVNCTPPGEFVSAAAIRDSVPAWVGTPVTIDHPTTGNQLRPAKRGDEVGYVRASRFEDGFLVLDVEVKRALLETRPDGPEILAALLGNGADVEVSTGYGLDLVMSEGTHDGEPYYMEHRNLEPDHLALLPVGVAGACSIEHGCGAARVNAGQTKDDLMKTDGNALTSFLRGLMARMHRGDEEDDADPAGADDGDEGATEHDEGTGEDATEGDDPAATDDDGDPAGAADTDDDTGEQGGAPDHSEEPKMNRDKVIKALAANSGVPFSEDEMAEFDDERLKSLATLAGLEDCGCGEQRGNSDANDDGAPAGEQANEDDAAQGADIAAIVAEQVKAGLESLKAEIAPALEVAANAQRQQESEKEALIEALKANERCRVTEESLRGMDLKALRGVAESFREVTYGPRGVSRAAALGSDVDESWTPAPSILAGNRDGEE